MSRHGQCDAFAAPRKGWCLHCHRNTGHDGLHYDLHEDAQWTTSVALDALSLERGAPPPAISVTFRIPRIAEQRQEVLFA